MLGRTVLNPKTFSAFPFQKNPPAPEMKVEQTHAGIPSEEPRTLPPSCKRTTPISHPVWRTRLEGTSSVWR